MELPTDFATYLTEIRPTKNQQDDLKKGHEVLRGRLREYEPLKDDIVSDFLQGSYRRATAVRPKTDTRPDVDIIVVTRFSESDYTPSQAMKKFEPFLDKYYEGKWRPQGRSFGIDLSYVSLDLVITSAPSEADAAKLCSKAVRVDADIVEEPDWRLHELWVPTWSRTGSYREILKRVASDPDWKLSPLRIPDRTTERWESTHPLEQIRWTCAKNASCNGHFVNVVKVVKWWRLHNYDEPKHPKGFPLERIVGECCPNNISSVADGFTRTLEAMEAKYAVHAQMGSKPVLPDYGVPEHDVFARITAEDFAAFHKQVSEGAKAARAALDESDRDESRRRWRKLLGPKFPKPEEKKEASSAGGYTEPRRPAVPGSGRFA